MAGKIKRLTSNRLRWFSLWPSSYLPRYNLSPQLLPVPNARTLRQYAIDTWQSFVALTYPSGLPSDTIDAKGMRALYTSPSNIGAYMWSTVAARDLKIITPREARQRIAKTLQTLGKIERHAASGMYYNWYSPETGEMLTTWPANGSTVYPFLSTVDNGWLATALIVVSNSVPQLRDPALALLNGMNFGFFEDKNNGLLYGGYWPFPYPNCNINGYTCFNFGALNTEPRIASYIGIAMGDLPPTHYFRMRRALSGHCDQNWPETEPKGVTQTYLGVDVFEGHTTYAGMNIVPSWGGSMFEALMVPLFVPEAQWGPASWGVNHPLYVQAHIHHGINEAQYGYWGFSPGGQSLRRLHGLRAWMRSGCRRTGILPTTTISWWLTALTIPQGASPKAHRRPAPSPMAWSPRTHPSWRCSSRRVNRCRTWPTCARASISTANGASGTRSTWIAGRYRAARWRWTRAW